MRRRVDQGVYGRYLRVLITVSMIAVWGCGGDGGGLPTAPSDAPNTNDSSSDAWVESMDLGDVLFLDFNSGDNLEINFDSESSGATYWAVLHSGNTDPGDFSLVIQSSGSAPAPTSNSPASLTIESSMIGAETDDNPMHELVRSWEEVYVQNPDVIPMSEPTDALYALTSALSVGDRKSFQVLNTLSSITSYAEVAGELRYISDDLLIYIDVEMVGSSNLTDSDIAELADGFEGHAMPIERNLFGRESDLNGDGTITILMTPVLNRMCLSNGIVTGFFFPGDLYERNDINPASNEREIFYTLVPDPKGEFCRSLGVEFTMNNILQGVLAHEYQHMISFNRHVFINGGSSEEPWLNEGLSHLAEDLSGFGQENYARYSLYLNKADTTSLIPSGLPTLAERGMAFMFLRYLYEQATDPEDFLYQLLNTDMTGVGNIVAHMGGVDASFDDFNDYFAHWQVALLLTGRDLTTDSRFVYSNRTIDPVTGNFQGICLHCDPQDGRGTILAGPAISEVSSFPLAIDIKSTTARFFQINSPGTQLTISGSDGIQLGGALIRLDAK